MRKPAFCTILLILGFCLALNFPAAATNYTYQDLGTLPGKTRSIPNDINAAGQVVGWSDSNSNGDCRAFLYSGGVMQDLGSLAPAGGGGASCSIAGGINDAGQVVGYSYNLYTEYRHAFLYSGGVMQDLGTFLNPFGYASKINNSGQIVGYSDGNMRLNAILYSAGVVTDLGYGTASDINASGQVVGFNGNAFLYSGGVMHDLGNLRGVQSYASGINASGQVVGVDISPDPFGGDGNHVFLYSGGAMQDLWTGGASAINAAGQVVGNANGHAVLYSGGVLQDLNDLTLNLPPGVVLSDAGAINDLSWIAGTGSNGHAFLLTTNPVPLPSTLLFLGSGLLGLASWRRLRKG